jgi:hypothetical protein
MGTNRKSQIVFRKFYYFSAHYTTDAVLLNRS